MVRCLGVFLVLALLLCGCAGERTELPDNTIKSAISSQTSSGADLPGNTPEQTGVKCYPLDDTGCYGCFLLGEELVLMRKADGGSTFSFYPGGKTANLGQNVVPTLAKMQVAEQGIGYFDGETKAMVFLNTDLLEIGRMSLPEDLEGDVWLSPDWKMLYYCSANGICTMDLQTGISRLLKEQKAFRQEITGGFGNGEVLRYELELTEGQKQVQLIDATSGIVLQEGEYLNGLITKTEQYFLNQNPQGVRQLRYGTGETHQVLWPAETDAQPQMLFENNAVAMVQTSNGRVDLSYYDLQTGKRMGVITVNNITEVLGLCGDGNHGVWLVGKNADGLEALYHWNAEENQANDDTIYTAPWYTPETPDTSGLAKVSETATAMSSALGVDILVWENAAAVAPADHVFTAEHSTQIYEYYLPELEKLLSGLPKDFFIRPSGVKLQIALVHGISGQPMWGSLAQSTNLQFWNDDVPVIALVLDENLERNFYHGIYHFIETQILSKSSVLYEWNALNPAGFVYDNNYITNQERTDTSYIEGEGRYFIDLFSMSYAKEDRARIFEYACMPGNEEMFKSSVLQAKLWRICNGIRTAFGLSKTETVFLWEQYLT